MILACVDIQLGRVYEGMQALGVLVAATTGEQLTEDNLIRGVLLQDLALHDSARDYYERVMKRSLSADGVYIPDVNWPN